MKKIELKDLRAIPPYETIKRGKISNGHDVSWIFIKLPNHFWTGYRGHPSLTDRELVEYGTPIPKDEVGELIDCDDEVLEKYEVLEREGVI